MGDETATNAPPAPSGATSGTLPGPDVRARLAAFGAGLQGFAKQWAMLPDEIGDRKAARILFPETRAASAESEVPSL